MSKTTDAIFRHNANRGFDNGDPYGWSSESSESSESPDEFGYAEDTAWELYVESLNAEDTELVTCPACLGDGDADCDWCCGNGFVPQPKQEND